jgi:hypothetical protein
LDTAAFMAWKLTVTIAMIVAATAASANIHQEIGMRYAKSCSHLAHAKPGDGRCNDDGNTNEF